MKKPFSILLAVLLFVAQAQAAFIGDQVGERYQIFLPAGTSYVIPATGSLAIWVYPTFAQTDNVHHDFVFARDAGGNTFTLLKFSDNQIYAGWNSGGTDHRIILSSGSYTLNQNAWNHFFMTWDDTANETHLYLNGTLIGSQTKSLTTFTSTTAFVGSNTGTLANPSSAFAEPAFWSRVVSASERGSLVTKFSPLFFRNGLQPYFPGIRNDLLSGNSTFIFRSHFGGYFMEGVAGFTNTLQAHPPIFYPRGMK